MTLSDIISTKNSQSPGKSGKFGPYFDEHQLHYLSPKLTEAFIACVVHGVGHVRVTEHVAPLFRRLDTRRGGAGRADGSGRLLLGALQPPLLRLEERPRAGRHVADHVQERRHRVGWRGQVALQEVERLARPHRHVHEAEVGRFDLVRGAAQRAGLGASQVLARDSLRLCSRLPAAPDYALDLFVRLRALCLQAVFQIGVIHLESLKSI